MAGTAATEIVTNGMEAAAEIAIGEIDDTITKTNAIDGTMIDAEAVEVIVITKITVTSVEVISVEVMDRSEKKTTIQAAEV